MNKVLSNVNIFIQKAVRNNLDKYKILYNSKMEFLFKSSHNRIIWIDLEMTGLDLAQDRILEVASLVTDNSLNIISNEFQMVVHQPEHLFQNMIPWCQIQHAKSGLIEESRNSSNSEEVVEEELLDFLRQHCPQGKCPMAGNCLYMDRVFIEKYMPRVFNYIGPNIIDVASINELAKRWHRKIEKRKKRKIGDHRALGDIKDSIQELLYYKNNIIQ